MLEYDYSLLELWLKGKDKKCGPEVKICSQVGTDYFEYTKIIIFKWELWD